MNARRFSLGLLLWLSASAAVQAADCRPIIRDAWVRAAPPGAPSLAGYLRLHNGCPVTATVVGVESLDFGMPMIHRTVEENGISRMRPAGKLEVAPGADLQFVPGGLHLMLMQPLRALPEDSVVRLRLVLGDGRRLYVEMPVRRNAP